MYNICLYITGVVLHLEAYADIYEILSIVYAVMSWLHEPCNGRAHVAVLFWAALLALESTRIMKLLVQLSCSFVADCAVVQLYSYVQRHQNTTERTTQGAESSSCAYSFAARNSLGTPCLLFCLTEDQGHYYAYHYGRQQDKCVFSNATLIEHSV